MANGDSTADKAVWVQGRSGEDSPIHLADRTDGVSCEREEKEKTMMRPCMFIMSTLCECGCFLLSLQIYMHSFPRWSTYRGRRNYGLPLDGALVYHRFRLSKLRSSGSEYSFACFACYQDLFPPRLLSFCLRVHSTSPNSEQNK